MGLNVIAFRSLVSTTLAPSQVLLRKPRPPFAIRSQGLDPRACGRSFFVARQSRCESLSTLRSDIFFRVAFKCQGTWYANLSILGSSWSAIARPSTQNNWCVKMKLFE